MNQKPSLQKSEARRLLGKLLGRHHREMLVSGDRCNACHNFSPTVKEVRQAIEAFTDD